MEPNRQSRCGIIAAVLFVGLAAAPIRAMEDVDPATWAPADAFAYIGVDDVDQAWRQISQTAAMRAFNDPRISKSSAEFGFVNKIFKKLKERIAGALEVSPDSLKSPFGGPLVIYLNPPPAADDEAAVVLIATIDDDATMHEYYDKATKKFRESADEYDEVRFAGESILTFQANPPEEGDDEKPDFELDPNSDLTGLNEEELAKLADQMVGELFTGDSLPGDLSVCLTADRLYVVAGAGGPDAIKDALRRERRGDSLADADDYKLMQRRFDPLGSIRFLVNLPAIAKHLRASDEESREVLAAIGMDSFRSIIGHFYFGGQDDDYESKSDVLVLLKPERGGLAKLLAMQNRDTNPPKAVDADNCFYLSLGLDLVDILDQIESMIRQTSPETADQMRQSLRAVPFPDGPYDLRAEILEKLRPAQAMGLSIGRPVSPDSVGLLVSIGHRDRSAFIRLIEKLRNSGGLPLMDRDFAGGTIYEFPMGGFSLAPTNDELLIGSVSAVESRMQGTPDRRALADDKAFQRVARHVPRESWLTLYVDAVRLYEAGLELAKQRDAVNAAAMTNAAAMMALEIAEQMTASIDADEPETARRMLKYQAQAILTIATTPDGVMITQVQSRPSAD